MKEKYKYLMILDCGLFIILVTLIIGYPQWGNIRMSDGRDIIIDDIAPKVALTFDDGPHPVYTAQLLDGLQERNVKCTFFLTGIHAKENSELVKRMVEEGHLIGNHTYTHMELTQNNIEQFIHELKQTSELLLDITGVQVEYVRPPYGCWNENVEKEVDMIPIFWTVDPLDWNTTDSSIIVQKVVSNIQDNDIILMHDYYLSSVDAALQIIDQLQNLGFQIVTVDEIRID